MVPGKCTQSHVLSVAQMLWFPFALEEIAQFIAVIVSARTETREANTDSPIVFKRKGRHICRPFLFSSYTTIFNFSSTVPFVSSFVGP